MPLLLELVLIVTGYALASLMLGMWLGERGRRKDAQRREGVIDVDGPEPAVVRAQGDVVPQDARSGPDLEAAKTKYIEDAVAEGFSPEAASADFDMMMAELYSDQRFA